MARDVVVDVSNILTNINNGNEPVAKALNRMRADGVNLYYDEQGFREAVTNNPREAEGVANGQTLQELGFRPAPPGSIRDRGDFHALNGGVNATIQDGASFQKNPNRDSSQKRVLVESKALGNLRDSAIGACAYANGFEIFSIDATFAAPGERQNQLDRTFTRVMETRKENLKAETEKAQSEGRPLPKQGEIIRGRGLRIAPESTALFGTNPPNTSTDHNLGRRMLGLPPYTQAGRGAQVGPMATPTPGMKSHEGMQTKMIGGILLKGAILALLDDYCIEKAMKKDVEEWETYIRQRQTVDFENGFLMVAIIKKWQPRDAAYATRSYVSMEVFEAYGLVAAEAMAAKNILPGLAPPTDEVSYSYVKIWIAPLKPRPVLTAEQSYENAYGKEVWYPRFRLVRHSLEPPPSYGEALSTLQASSMYDILQVLDHLPESQFNELKANLRIVKEDGNKARFRIAFAAAENHKSSSSFGWAEFIRDRQNAEDFAVLGNDFEKNCIKDWVSSGSGAVQHDMQGRWDIVFNGKRYEYSFRLSGTVTWRDKSNPGPIGGEGTWDVTSAGVRVQWPKTGTVETFFFPINPNQQKARCVMKAGTFDMSATKTNAYP